MQRYPTDLTGAAWTLLAPLIPAAKPGGRPRTTDMREVVNAILYSCQVFAQQRGRFIGKKLLRKRTSARRYTPSKA